FLAVRRVPDAERIVPAGRGQSLAIGAKSHAGDFALVSFQCEFVRTIGGVPYLDLRETDGTRAARRREPFAVRAKRDALDPVTMPFVGKLVVAAGNFPHLHFPGFPAFPAPAGRGQALAIWAERDAGNVIGVARENTHLLAAGRVPNPYSLVAASGSQKQAVGTHCHAVDRPCMSPER